jgi:chemotaxis signal transduction protein
MNEGTLGSARLLVFRVGTLACAAEVDFVREILPRLPTTRIPGAPSVVAGLVNVRGTLVTVVEGWRALGQLPPPPSTGLPTAAQESQGSTIILEVAAGKSGKGGGAAQGSDADNGAHKLIGFTVDEVLDMLAGGDTALEDRQGLPGVDRTLVRAVGRRKGGGELVVVLDVAALLGPILTS